MMRRKLFVQTVGLFFVLTCSASAAVYPLLIFTENGPFQSDPEINLSVDVTPNNDAVDFTFYNISTVDCSITSIYFDDGSLLGISNIINGPGTLFTDSARPQDLPGGNLLDPPFETTADFNAVGQQPAPFNGVNNTEPGYPLEWVTVTFELNGGTFDDVIDELNDGSLRIGLHVTSFPDDSSESAIIPEPATLSMLVLGTLLLRRKRKR